MPSRSSGSIVWDFPETCHLTPETFRSVRIAPAELQAFHQLPDSFVQRRGNAVLLAPLHDCAVHEIHFGLALGEHVLQHRSAVFTSRSRSLLYEHTRIAVQFDAEHTRYRLAFGNQIVEQLSSRR